MSVEPEVSAIVARLQEAVASEQLSAPARSQAQGMLTRLRRGVRIVIVGPQGSGKSDLCSLLLAADLADVPPQVAARLFVKGSDPVGVDTLETSVGQMWRARLPGDLLTHMQVLEIAGSRDPAVHAARVRWALSEADMALWCGSDFDAVDAALWSEVPDALKDHSFLVLTGADLLADAGVLKDRIAALQAVAAEEFHSLFPTTTKSGRDSLRQQGCLPDAQVQSSGVKALTETLCKLAASGRQADLDGALLFLQRHGIAVTVPAAPVAVDPVVAPVQIGTYARALDLIEARRAEMSMTPDRVATEVAPFLAWCGAVAEDLLELAAEETDDGPDFSIWREDLFAAGDKLVLMSMENDLRSAADAASILLQINRDLLARAVS